VEARLAGAPARHVVVEHGDAGTAVGRQEDGGRPLIGPIGGRGGVLDEAAVRRSQIHRVLGCVDNHCLRHGPVGSIEQERRFGK
jgi:hypothetical protein